jgi:hypothetical protein
MFILEADSGWQMVMGRVRTMLAANPCLTIDVMMPLLDDVITSPAEINPDIVVGHDRLRFIEHEIMPNALATRYDFNWKHVAFRLGLADHRVIPEKRYTHVYLNDPMHLRNFRAMFHLVAGYQPKFVVHSHFIDNPECPKFPVEGSLWMGQCEAARRADFNFWQCESAMNVFFDSMSKEYLPHVVDAVKAKSMPWDDGYSSEEINVKPDMKNVRFDEAEFKRLTDGKLIVFVPNRVGGRGRSSDYTNCGKFLFEHANELYRQRQDFVIIAGNPSQKFTNDELAQLCVPYVKLVPDALNRDEYRYVARKAHIAVGLYDQDSYGGTAARECVDLGCYPLWNDRYEYSLIKKETNYPFVAAGFDTLNQTTNELLDFVKRKVHEGSTYIRDLEPLRKHIRARCSYEKTTPKAMKAVGLL